MKRLLIIPLLITGCADIKLYKNVSPEQAYRDTYECKLEGQKAIGFVPDGNPFIIANNERRGTENCLRAKGYVERPTKE